MIEKHLCEELSGISIFTDSTLEKEQILIGRKEGKKNFVLMHPDIYELIFSEDKLNNERYEKLKRILEEL
jgi:hypothetical protein